MNSMLSLMTYCRKLPHVTEDVKWECHPVFSIGSKMFAIFDCDKPKEFSCKAAIAEFPRLIHMPGIIPAPYLARHHWIKVTREGKLPVSLMKELLWESYVQVREKLSAKVRKTMTSL